MHFMQCRYAQNGTYTLKDSPHPQRSVSSAASDVYKRQVEDSVKGIKEVKDAKLELVWEPPWDKSMMSEAAKLELNL